LHFCATKHALHFAVLSLLCWEVRTISPVPSDVSFAGPWADVLMAT
jgi:hypothetical protein